MNIRKKGRNHRWWGPWLRICRFFLILYAGLVLVVAGCQRGLIYYPERAAEEALRQRASAMGWEAWKDGEDQFAGWHRIDAVGRDHLVIFHGNAGHALMREYWVGIFDQLGEDRFSEVSVFEYPGYGFREGRPSEKAIFEKTLLAMEPLVESIKPPDRLFLLGESLGSGVATWVAEAFPDSVDGLLLVTPFTDLAAVGRHHFPYLPVGLLLRDRYDNVRQLEAYRGPVVFVVAGQDRVVPARFGRDLYEGYQGPKRLKELSEADHNTLLHFADDAFWQNSIDFLRQDH